MAFDVKVRLSERPRFRGERPLAFFSPYRPSFIDNPYPALARLRAEEPVHRSAELDAWVLTAYDECVRVLRDHERFSADPGRAAGRVAKIVGQQRSEPQFADALALGNCDPPDHARLRRLVNRFFTPQAVERMRPQIEVIGEELLAEAAAGEPFDVMSGFAELLPVMVVLELIGFPEADRPEVRRWARTFTAARVDTSADRATVDAGVEALEQFAAYLRRRAETRHDGGGDDLLSMVSATAGEDGPFSGEQLASLLIYVSLAGNGATAAAIGNGTLALSQHGEQLSRLPERPVALARAVDELLRYDSPTQAVMRWARCDVEVRGRTVSAGETVLVHIGAANRDPKHFPDPDRLDLERSDAHRHLSFGTGAHFCLGMPLARMEVAIALGVLIRRFPALRLAEHPAPERGESLLLRVPRCLCLVG